MKSAYIMKNDLDIDTGMLKDVTTMATDNGYCLSISYGASKYDIGDRVFDYPYADGGVRVSDEGIIDGELIDNRDKSIKFTVGKGISDNLSLELSRVNAGRSKLAFRASEWDEGFDSVYVTQKTSTLDLNLVYKLPRILDTNIYVKVGPSFVKTKSKYYDIDLEEYEQRLRDENPGFPFAASAAVPVTNNEISLHTGVGIMKKLWGCTFILEYDKYQDPNSGREYTVATTAGIGRSRLITANMGPLAGDVYTLTGGIKINF